MVWVKCHRDKYLSSAPDMKLYSIPYQGQESEKPYQRRAGKPEGMYPASTEKDSTLGSSDLKGLPNIAVSCPAISVLSAVSQYPPCQSEQAPDTAKTGDFFH